MLVLRKTARHISSHMSRINCLKDNTLCARSSYFLRWRDHLLKSVLLGVMRLSLSEPGLGPLPVFGFSVTAAAARGTAFEQPHRLLMLWRALLTLLAVREIAPLCKTYGDLHRLQVLRRYERPPLCKWCQGIWRCTGFLAVARPMQAQGPLSRGTHPSLQTHGGLAPRKANAISTAFIAYARLFL